MSTYFYLECLDHEPPLQSSDEVSQHDDEYLQDAMRLARGEEPQVEDSDPWQTASYFRRHATEFLEQHKGCRLDVVSEYGEHLTLDGARSYEPPAKAFVLTPEEAAVVAQLARDNASRSLWAFGAREPGVLLALARRLEAAS